MNKDLAEESAIWRALHGGAGAPLLVLYLCTCPLVVKELPKMFCGGLWVRLWRRAQVFDALLSVNYCAIAICVSVMAVQEKCDEKNQGREVARQRVGDGHCPTQAKTVSSPMTWFTKCPGTSFTVEFGKVRPATSDRRSSIAGCRGRVPAPDSDSNTPEPGAPWSPAGSARHSKLG